MGWFGRLRMDLRPLKDSVEFRKLFASRTITMLGGEITEIALLANVAKLTASPLAVGLLGVVEVVPVILFSLYGGLLADRFDRRALAVGCEFGLLISTAGLVVDAALPHPALWPLYVGAGLIAALGALQRPSLDAAVPRVVDRARLAASSALLSVGSNVSSIIGPAAAGLLVAGPGAAWAYGIDAVSYVVSFAFLFALRPLPRASAADEDATGLRGIATGLRYAVGRGDLLGSYLVDILVMVLAYPVGLLPFMAITLHAPWAQGLLFSASAAGALLASATSGWCSSVHHHGRAIAIAATIWGLTIVAFGLSPNIGLAVAFLVLSGGADMYSGIFRTTLWNTTIPDEMRGRLAGLEVLSYNVGPVLGQVRGGALGGVLGVRRTLWTGGVACVFAAGAVCAALPRLWRYDARTDAPRQAETAATS